MEFRVLYKGVMIVFCLVDKNNGNLRKAAEIPSEYPSSNTSSRSCYVTKQVTYGALAVAGEEPVVVYMKGRFWRS
jgi:hypothetical protein